MPLRPLGDRRRPAAADADGARPRGGGRRRGGRARTSTTSQVGDHVVMVFVPSCGHCVPCAEGRPALCEPGAAANGAGTLLSGARRLAPRRADRQPPSRRVGLCRITPSSRAAPASRSTRELPLDEAALFGCAVLTGVGAVVNTAQVPAGPTVAVVGLGGVGLSSLLGAVASGASAGRRGRSRRRQARPCPPARRDPHLQRRSTRTPSSRSARPTERRRRFRLRDGGLGAGARTRLQDHPARRHDRHRRPAAADRDAAAAAGEPRRRGAHAEGQLHRHLRAGARPAALRRPLPARQAAGRPADERHAAARGDQRGLRPPARGQGRAPGGDRF